MVLRCMLKRRQAQYGIDAPWIVGGLLLSSFILLWLALAATLIASAFWSWLAILATLAAALLFMTMGCWMLYGIVVAKPHIAAQMISQLGLRGDETVLDLGCGRGLLLCAAAKRLPQGEAHGIDLWSSTDQSGNSLEQTLANAACEGVADRVYVHSGDVRALPFADGTFDVVVSSLCLHNIGDRRGREQALDEALRVLKPGGRFAIADILCAEEYTAFFAARGVPTAAPATHYSYCPSLTVINGRKP